MKDRYLWALVALALVIPPAYAALTALPVVPSAGGPIPAEPVITVDEAGKYDTAALTQLPTVPSAGGPVAAHPVIMVDPSGNYAGASFDTFPPLAERDLFTSLHCMVGTSPTTGPEWFTNVSGGAWSALTTNSPILSSAAGICEPLLTAATDRVGLGTAPTSIYLVAGPAKFFAALFENTASNGTDTYTTRVGFIDTFAAEPIDGCFFRYTNGVNSGKWQIVTRSNNSETAQDSGITFNGSLTPRFFGVVATATSCAFYSGASQTANSPIITNIPSGSGRFTGVGISALKSLGSSAVVPFYLDYMAVAQDLNRNFPTLSSTTTLARKGGAAR